ncbi:hypothetical protein L596_024881 [Steinernema carpocapsae]|uniref:Uncharacterized protein n=1 Tax=Steinernema carpocapsae TaxID=34508 RepID=A0A4U5M685_STECR|nr:hypothetical protein L596_024881 [Steinernema carpocapsae]
MEGILAASSGWPTDRRRGAAEWLRRQRFRLTISTACLLLHMLLCRWILKNLKPWETDATSAARLATSRASARRAAEAAAETARATTAASRATCPATAPTEDPAEEIAPATTADSRDTSPAIAPLPASEERDVRRIVSSLLVLSCCYT